MSWWSEKLKSCQLNPSDLMKTTVQLHANEDIEAAAPTLKLSRWYLILCISRKPLPREQNYLTVDKECQVIKRRLEALKHRLVGWHLHLCSEEGCGKADNPLAAPWVPVRFSLQHCCCFSPSLTAAVETTASKGIHEEGHYLTEIDPGRSAAKKSQFYREIQLTNVSATLRRLQLDSPLNLRSMAWHFTFSFFLQFVSFPVSGGGLSNPAHVSHLSLCNIPNLRYLFKVGALRIYPPVKFERFRLWNILEQALC